jgi:hypothetical protein
MPLASGPAPSGVSVVIPTLNEADSIGWVLGRIPEWVSEVVLVDGLSVDETERVARQLRPDLVVVHQRAPGKGSALRAGFAAAQGEHIVMLDADGSLDPAEMPRFIDALEEGADFVKGSRYLSGGGSADLTRLRSAGNRALARLANLLYGARFTDLCYGYCAFRRCHLEALALTATGFEIETQLALNAVSANLEIREVPSFELPRHAGVSNLTAYRDARRVLRTLLARRAGVITAAPTQDAGEARLGTASRDRTGLNRNHWEFALFGMGAGAGELANALTGNVLGYGRCAVGGGLVFAAWGWWRWRDEHRP